MVTLSRWRGIIAVRDRASSTITLTVTIGSVRLSKMDRLAITLERLRMIASGSRNSLYEIALLRGRPQFD